MLEHRRSAKNLRGAAEVAGVAEAAGAAGAAVALEAAEVVGVALGAEVAEAAEGVEVVLAAGVAAVVAVDVARWERQASESIPVRTFHAPFGFDDACCLALSDIIRVIFDDWHRRAAFEGSGHLPLTRGLEAREKYRPFRRHLHRRDAIRQLPDDPAPLSWTLKSLGAPWPNSRSRCSAF